MNAPPQPSFNETAETSPGDALAAVTALQAGVMSRPGVRLGNCDEISMQFLDHQSVTKTGSSTSRGTLPCLNNLPVHLFWGPKKAQ